MNASWLIRLNDDPCRTAMRAVANLCCVARRVVSSTRHSWFSCSNIYTTSTSSTETWNQRTCFLTLSDTSRYVFSIAAYTVVVGGVWQGASKSLCSMGCGALLRENLYIIEYFDSYIKSSVCSQLADDWEHSGERGAIKFVAHLIGGPKGKWGWKVQTPISLVALPLPIHLSLIHISEPTRPY